MACTADCSSASESKPRLDDIVALGLWDEAHRLRADGLPSPVWLAPLKEVERTITEDDERLVSPRNTQGLACPCHSQATKPRLPGGSIRRYAVAADVIFMVKVDSRRRSGRFSQRMWLEPGRHLLRPMDQAKLYQPQSSDHLGLGARQTCSSRPASPRLAVPVFRVPCCLGQRQRTATHNKVALLIDWRVI